MTSETYTLSLGQFELTMFRDGGGPRTASGFLPSAPQDELERIIQSLNLDPDALDFSLKPILVKVDDQLLLIDTGLGGSAGNLPMRLQAMGVMPDQINRVIITHGHRDHVGGMVDLDGGFTYPNAEYVIWHSEWEYWTADERLKELAKSNVDVPWRMLLSQRERVRFLDEQNNEILPGITAIPTPGHTVGHIAVQFESNGEKLLHVADVAHHTFQLLCPQWSPEFDYDKEQAAETRRAVFESAADEGILFSAYHFSFPGVGRIIRHEDVLQWQPL